jgi:hypothetical protein
MKRGVAQLLMPRRQMRQQVRHHRLWAMLTSHRPLSLIWRHGAYSTALPPSRAALVLNRFPITFAPRFQWSINWGTGTRGGRDVISTAQAFSQANRELVFERQAAERGGVHDARLAPPAAADWSRKFIMEMRTAPFGRANSDRWHSHLRPADPGAGPSFDRQFEASIFRQSYYERMQQLATDRPAISAARPGHYFTSANASRATPVRTGNRRPWSRALAQRSIALSPLAPRTERALIQPSRRYQPSSYAKADVDGSPNAAAATIRLQQSVPDSATRSLGEVNSLASKPAIDFRHPALPESRKADAGPAPGAKPANPAAPLDLDHLSREIWKRFEAKARLESERYGRG